MLSSAVTSDLCDVHPVRYILTLTRYQDVTSQTVKFEFVSSAGCIFSNFLVKIKMPRICGKGESLKWRAELTLAATTQQMLLFTRSLLTEDDQCSRIIG